MDKVDNRTPEQVRGQHGACDTMHVLYRKTKTLSEPPKDPVVINVHDFNPKLHEEVEVVEEGEESTFADMSKKELQEHLTAAGVEFAKNASKDALVALAEQHKSAE